MLFQNLLSNAVKFRAPDRPPRVLVASRMSQNRVEIRVADNGIGISEEHHDRVFGLFQRLNAQSEFKGTGIGLTICQRVMSNHNGDIRISTETDEGTEFTMTFPADQA